jgi:SAM-dependent methyltransferase
LDLLDNADGADVVVGSRYMGRKSLAGWNVLRRTLTHTGHFLTKNLLSVPYDATGALRLYDLKRVPEHAFDLVSSNGYSFFFESLHLLHRNGYRIREIPIDLPPRTYGHSKMDMSEVLKSVRLLLATISNRLFNPEMFVVVEPMSESEIEEGPTDEQAWDEYWKTDNYSGRVLYNVIAAFYRKVIIRPSLNRFVRQHFEPGATVLHAGSGGGQVDPDVRRYVNVIALDISPKALEFYRQVNGPESETLLGSIFDMPLEAGSVDGIYNLGVMEHFAEEEIGQILEDFRRVLKDDGKLLIFWPPEFGLSVTFFKGLTFLLKNVLRRENPQLHPDEITRLRSRRHAEAVFGAAGFSMLEYHFGFRDAFTYVVVVAVKR